MAGIFISSLDGLSLNTCKCSHAGEDENRLRRFLIRKKKYFFPLFDWGLWFLHTRCILLDKRITNLIWNRNFSYPPLLYFVLTKSEYPLHLKIQNTLINNDFSFYRCSWPLKWVNVLISKILFLSSEDCVLSLPTYLCKLSPNSNIMRLTSYQNKARLLPKTF